MSHLTIRTLGQATILVDGLEPIWQADSARTLLFYLLCHPNGQPYATILQALWNPEHGHDSMNCLRVAVCRLRVSLGHPGSVVTDHRRYRLAQAVLECADTFQFTESLACAQRSATAQQRLSGYERAFSHYSGDYLPLERGEWAQQFRMELCAEAARAGIKLSRLLDESGHPEAATDALATALKRDPLISEQYHQQLMIRLALRADRYAAIKHYRRYVRYLRAEVGDTPMHETTALAQHIKDGLPLGSIAALGSFGLSGHLTTSLM